MSIYTLGSLRFMTREKLAELIRSNSPSLAIIDVRDDDFIGGHIRGCTHVPVHTHDFRMPELVRTLRDKDLVVFHCALSQQRGPGSALRYLRERDRMAGRGEVGVRKDGKDLADVQEVAVLEGGFVRWQQKYGEDAELTEGYDKEIWSDE